MRPWKEPSKPITSIRSGWPLATWYLRAVFSAHSTASVPELVKNTTSAKLLAHSSLASASWSGMRKMLETCQSFCAWSFTASTSLGLAWPSALTAMPARQSRYSSPSVE